MHVNLVYNIVYILVKNKSEKQIKVRRIKVFSSHDLTWS